MPKLDRSKITAKATASGNISINAFDINHFRLIKKIVTTLQTEFHTFTLTTNGALKVVIKGVPTDITDDEFKSDLFALNFSVNYVPRLDTSSKPLPIYLATIVQTSD